MSCRALLVIGVLTFVTLRAAALAPFLAVAAALTPAAAVAQSPVPVPPTPAPVAAPVPPLVLTPAARAAADGLPADAQAEIDQFRREAARIGLDAEAKVAAQKADLVKRLRALQTKYTKEGKLDEAVAIRDRVRLLEGGFAVGQQAQVQDGQNCVPYTRYATPSRRWVGKDGVRGVAGPAVQYRACQRVEVQWGNTWWAAEVLQVRGNQYYIHYTGWGNNWDEWVTDCRIRPCGPGGTYPRR
jgi:hypothetical protein